MQAGAQDEWIEAWVDRVLEGMPEGTGASPALDPAISQRSVRGGACGRWWGGRIRRKGRSVNHSRVFAGSWCTVDKSKKKIHWCGEERGVGSSCLGKTGASRAGRGSSRNRKRTSVWFSRGLTAALVRARRTRAREAQYISSCVFLESVISLYARQRAVGTDQGHR